MTEPENKDIRLIKLKNGDDVIAYMTGGPIDSQVMLRRPVLIFVDSYPEEGRSVINVKEWLHPMLAAKDETPLRNEDILFIAEVNPEFVDEYVNIANIFYTKMKPKIRKGFKEVDEVTAKATTLADVISLVDRKGKPIH
jgi:hypothetical protein